MNPIQELYTRNRATYEFLILLMTHARSCNRLHTIRRFTEKLLHGCADKGIGEVDLNEIFRFVLFHGHLLVTMRSEFADVLILKRFGPNDITFAFLKDFNFEFVFK